MTKDSNTNEDILIPLRLSPELKKIIDKRSVENMRSRNSEIVYQLYRLYVKKEKSE